MYPRSGKFGGSSCLYWKEEKKKDAADGCAAETFDSGDLVTSESLASLKFAGGRHLLAIDQ